MEKIKFKEPLESFLIKCKIKEKFIKNIKECNENISIKDIADQPINRSLFVSAFSWNKTKEGILFWSIMNDAWNRAYEIYEQSKSKTP